MSGDPPPKSSRFYPRFPPGHSKKTVQRMLQKGKDAAYNRKRNHPGNYLIPWLCKKRAFHKAAGGPRLGNHLDCTGMGNGPGRTGRTGPDRAPPILMFLGSRIQASLLKIREGESGERESREGR